MTEEPHITPGVRRISTAAPGALMRITEKRVHHIMSPLKDTDAWIFSRSDRHRLLRRGPAVTDYDEYGYVVDEYGHQIGWCNSCGEEAEADTECCEDGEVVPYSEGSPR